MDRPESYNGRAATPARLLLIRHGESTWNARGLWQGQADPPLSERGEAQARLAAEELAALALERVVSSDLRRASRTAEIISELLGLGEVVLDSGLREIDVGDWSGLSRAEIETKWPGMRVAWSENRLPAAPGGELLSSFTERIVAAMQRAALLSAAGPVLVIGHSKVVSMLERFAGLDPLRATHLAGRWFRFEPMGRLRGLEPVNLLGGMRQPAGS